jgi:transcriptional regulator with XRE-family HTH domain
MPGTVRIFGRKLSAARQKKALTQRELGEAMGGLTDETISRIERNEVAGTFAKHLPKFAKALGMTLEQFRAEICVPPEHSAFQKPPKNIAMASGFPQGLSMRGIRLAKTVPEFQIGVAASRRVEKLEEHPDANRLVSTAGRRAFVAPVDGDCQQPKWKDGELVIFSYDAVEREGILPGKSYYLAFTDGSTTFKRLYPDESDPEKYILRCWNRTKFPKDQKIHRDEVIRIARAVSKQVTVDEGEDEE